jgi:hypothetical protein
LRLVDRAGADGCALLLFDEDNLFELRFVYNPRRMRGQNNLWRMVFPFPFFLGLPQHFQQRIYQCGVQVILQFLDAVQRASSIGRSVYER